MTVNMQQYMQHKQYSHCEVGNLTSRNLLLSKQCADVAGAMAGLVELSLKQNMQQRLQP